MTCLEQIVNIFLNILLTYLPQSDQKTIVLDHYKKWHTSNILDCKKGVLFYLFVQTVDRMKKKHGMLYLLLMTCWSVLGQKIIGPINSDDPKWRTVNAPKEMTSLVRTYNIIF